MEEFTNCQICFEKYDAVNRIPLLLVTCKFFKNYVKYLHRFIFLIISILKVNIHFARDALKSDILNSFFSYLKITHPN